MKQTLKKVLQEGLSAEEAIENLNVLANMPLDIKTPIGILKNKRITTDKEEYFYKDIEWLFIEDPSNFIEHIKPSYRTIFQYLEFIEKKEDIDFENIKVQKSIESIMALISDASARITEFFDLVGKKINFKKEKEFEDIQIFYLKHILPKFKQGKREDIWHKDWEKDKESNIFDFDDSALKSFDGVLEDEDYELFQIKDSYDHLLIKDDLIKDLKVYADFEEFLLEEDFFLDIEKFKNMDRMAKSGYILKSVAKESLYFYKMHLKTELAKILKKSLMALMLSSCSKNLDSKKDCFSYFKDFQLFLRRVFLSREYFNLKQESFLKEYLDKICFYFFNSPCGIKEEVICYIHFMIKDKNLKGEFLPTLLEKDLQIYKFLKRYKGNFKKILSVLREEEFFGFDPIFQDNLSEKIYDFKIKNKKIDLLHMPSPTKQMSILKADVLDEFLSFLHCNGVKHLLFNLQSRNFIREGARSNSLEHLLSKKYLNNKLFLVSLDKNSDFYHQTKDFEKNSSFEIFSSILKKEVFGPKFFFEKREFEDFIIKIIDLIHKELFYNKVDLAKVERKDFIEVFYHFLILKFLEKIEPNSISFTCKDGIDIGACLNFSFFYFLKILKKGFFSSEEKDFLLYLIYAPSLIIRERKVNSERLNRAVSFLQFIENKKDGVLKIFDSLFKFPVE